MKSSEPATSDVVSMAQDIVSQQHIPCATYRFQFNAQFGFRDATALVPYLYDLGISDCYASPLLKARQGSTHGYDTVDHSQLNDALGSQEDFEAFITALHDHKLGLIYDIVPNHMGIDDDANLWWMDVLENGPSSVYAHYFDIDWEPVKPELRNKVLLPILGDQYGNVLESGQLRLSYEEGAFWIYYYEHKLPVAPGTYSIILNEPLEQLTASLGEDHPDLQEYASILTAISYLPPRDETDPDKILERHREKEIIKRRISTLYSSSAAIQSAIDATVVRFNGNVQDTSSFDLLDSLIHQQAYRPAFWRVATEEINYRRFFDINDLAAIRVELKEVFAATHQLIFQLLAQGKGRGLRIDHPDGLWDPPGYFRQLQAGFVTQRVLALLGDAADPQEVERNVEAWFAAYLKQKRGSAASLPLYVVAEKILSEDEQLPDDWAVHGTTGYDFLNEVNGIFVDGKQRSAFDKIYQHFIGREINFQHLVNSNKKMIMLVSLVSQVNEISYQLERIAEKNRKYRDFTLNGLTFAMREVIAGLPVYRTYLTGTNTANKQDRAHIKAAVREARRRNPRTAGAVFDFIEETLSLHNVQTFREENRSDLTDFVMKVQQLTGPVMAKGVEDTAFYVYNRLVSLNEVGGHPQHFGLSVEEFHQRNNQRQRRWPHSMLTTSTHDTKRSEDVRARISVLSEIPDDWKAALTRWSRMNAGKKTDINGTPSPERNDEYLLYQTLIGAWHEETPGSPEFAQFRQRIAAYMQKAINEAKVHTSWINPNVEYDTAMQDFVARVLSDEGKNAFLKDFMTFQRRIDFHGQFNALSQVLLKLTSPGVPDIYQGMELWNYSLVDPDNRRPVNFQQRMFLLGNLKRQISRLGENLIPLARELLDNSYDGRIKLFIIYRTLNFRRDNSDLFAHGEYVPLEAVGEKQQHVCAFTRTLKPQGNSSSQQEIVVAVPRLVVALSEGVTSSSVEQPPLGGRVWKNTWLTLPHAQVGQVYQNLFTGEGLTVGEQDGVAGLPMSSVCAHFPVALLVAQRPQEK